MTITHIAANYIFDGKRFIKNSYISVDQTGSILYVGQENQAKSERERMIFYNGIICPAFVNAHCHIELSGFKNKTVLGEGLTSFIKSIQKNKENEQNYSQQCIENADNIMYQNGIQVVADIMNGDYSLKTKLKSNIFYYSFFEMYGLKKISSSKLDYEKNNIYSLFHSNNLPISVTPHSFYSVGEVLMKYIISNSDDIFSIHFMESVEEAELFYNYSGKLKDFLFNSKDLLDSFDCKAYIYKCLKELKRLNKNIILVHNTELLPEFVDNCNNVFLCLCPHSNMMISNRLPSQKLLQKDLQFVVGTDSLASNENLCILSELKTLSYYYSFIGLDKLLKWASYNGAKALKVNNKFGSFELGMNPGILLIEDVDLINMKLLKETKIRRLF